MSYAQTNTIPIWIKNNAGWWADGAIDDETFVQGMEFLIKEGIIEIQDNNKKACNDVYFDLITSTVVLDHMSNPDNLAMSYAYDGYHDYVDVIKEHSSIYLKSVELIDKCNISGSKQNLYGYFHEGIISNQ